MAIAPPQIPGFTAWRPMARGGFSTVWEARQTSLDRLVAVKIDSRHLDTDEERRRFLRESGAAGRLSGHPGIVTVHDAGLLADGRPYLVMELCPGGSLTAWLTAQPRPTAGAVREVGGRIADALAAAHSRGVLHRDVKPANILIDAYGNAGLADFGLAALPELEAEDGGHVKGFTPAYAPPEALRYAPATEAGDVYSLSATLYALLSGAPPKRVGRQLPRLDGVDEGLMDTLVAGLAEYPLARPTAAEFRDRLLGVAEMPLASASGSREPGAAPVPAVEPERLLKAEAEPAASRPGRRRTGLVVVLGVVALLVAIIALTVSLGSPSGGPAAAPTPTLAPIPTPTATPSPSPTPVGAPARFADCSAELGDGVFCPTEPECWAGIISISDLPSLGTPRKCTNTHVYQTYAAGRLAQPVRRQSQLEALRDVKRVCTVAMANKRLRPPDRRKDWEILVLPPQETGAEDIYRCLAGHGETGEPLRLG